MTLDQNSGSIQVSKVPEPASIVGLVALGMLGVASTLKKKQASCYKLGLSSQSLPNLLNLYSSPTSSVNW
ncbi:PEP-CTERM sorting domain-containing protein [Nostoc sp. CCCryo 231-06]|nr:PEP-CTERM sorting domain-containing protein [Nostoc sp. CCCryo 231-06]